MSKLVILHGWGSKSSSFDDVAERLRAAGIGVFAFDLPGFGSAERLPEPWSLDDYVRYVGRVLEGKGIGRAYLLGHSFGGRISIKFAVRFPERVAGLILYDAAGIKPLVTLKHKIFRAIAKLGRLVPAIAPLKRFFRKALYAFAGSRDYYRAEGVMRETMLRVIGEDLKPLLSFIRARTLVLWGARDRETPLADGELMHREIRGSQFHIQEGVGHSWHKEAPEEFAEVVRTFIAQEHV